MHDLIMMKDLNFTQDDMNVMRNYIKQIILLGRIDIKLKSINFSILQQNKIPEIKNCIHSTDLSILQQQKRLIVILQKI